MSRTSELPESLLARLRTSAGSAAAPGGTLVLASGGLDSSTLLALALADGISVTALFVDYGQAARRAEQKAVHSVCDRLSVPWRFVRYRGTFFGAGELRGRNAFLLHMALMEAPATARMIMIGVHAGTGYVDCSPAFIELMQRSFDLYTGGTVAVSAPFADLSKRDVYQLATDLNVPIEATHSCEAGDAPCSVCLSCLDRNGLASERPHVTT